VAGIIQAYPDLRLQIEGYTDSTGSLEHNQELSERRAAAVRDFLVQQGVSINNVTAQGFGPSNPVASNSTPQGRQMNRRVDLVVNGESIAAQGRAVDQNGIPAMASPARSNPRQPAPITAPPR
jgi:outer membrane protein OmpA-like peptidoglycan-associated protein